MNTAEALARGAELHRAGRLAEAEALYRAVLAQEPRNADALHLLGLIAGAAGQTDAAVALIREAIRVMPSLAPALYNLGRLLQNRGELADAEACYRRALAYQPENADAYNNLGGVLQAQGRDEEALSCYASALRVRPESAEALSNMGMALQQLGRSEEAVALYHKALTLQPGYAQAHHNLGEALQDLHRPAEAIAAYEQALKLQPDFGDAHCGLAFALLRQGEMARGWKEYAWRFKRSDAPAQARTLPGEPWDGGDPAGRRILIYGEQGFGDTIQFVRYAPLLAQRGAAVAVECQEPLARLFTSLRDVQVVFARGDPLPDFDSYAPVASLPGLCGTTLATIPAHTPYLHANEVSRRRWRERIPPSEELRAGLVWSANPANQQGRSRRSMEIAELAPVLELPGARFYSLQTGEAAKEAPQQVVDLAPELHDFADTAAAIDQLDLVITVDTAVAHLAGALGRPVWVMLPYLADWRWLADRDDSPWYPTMRLFRQPKWGDWRSVSLTVASALDRLCRASGTK